MGTFFTLSLRLGLPLNLELAEPARLAGQQAQGTFLFPSPSAGIIETCCHIQIVCGCQGYEGSHAWETSTLPTEQSPQPGFVRIELKHSILHVGYNVIS